MANKTDSDGFQIVTKKSRKCKQPLTPVNCEEGEPFDPEAFKVKLWQTRQELKPSSFIRDFKETWIRVQEKLEADPAFDNIPRDSVEEGEEDGGIQSSSVLPPELLERLGRTTGAEPKRNILITSIVCYGLGNFSSCVIARYQLGFLLLLSNIIQIPHAKCFCYDPRFTEAEKAFLEELGFSLITENEEGKRRCAEPTLLFMPHCGKPLYNNLLWANWGQYLTNLVILGNSFTSFHERIPEAQLKSEALYIASILHFTHEERIKNSFQHRDIFNDLSFHIFTSERLKDAPNDMWLQKDAPCYDHIEDLEIILKNPE